jgi:KAP family P-loop domain
VKKKRSSIRSRLFKEPLVVMVDDIDRLNSDEIRHMLRLVRLIAVTSSKIERCSPTRCTIFWSAKASGAERMIFV